MTEYYHSFRVAYQHEWKDFKVTEVTLDGRDCKTYRGTKTLKAWPMTRGEYNTYRGWTPPEGEDQAVDGYLVEYAPVEGEEPNVTGHAGYVSWSPAIVFQQTYRETPDDWLSRVQDEAAELDERIGKLRAFRSTSQYADLPQNAKDLLAEQETYMGSYSVVLHQRIAEAPAPAPVAEDDQIAASTTAGGN